MTLGVLISCIATHEPSATQALLTLHHQYELRQVSNAHLRAQLRVLVSHSTLKKAVLLYYRLSMAKNTC